MLVYLEKDKDLKDYLSDNDPDYLADAIVRIFDGNNNELEINDII